MMYGTTYKKNTVCDFMLVQVFVNCKITTLQQCEKKTYFLLSLMAATNEALQLSKLNLKIGWIMNMSPH